MSTGYRSPKGLTVDHIREAFNAFYRGVGFDTVCRFYDIRQREFKDMLSFRLPWSKPNYEFMLTLVLHPETRKPKSGRCI